MRTALESGMNMKIPADLSDRSSWQQTFKAMLEPLLARRRVDATGYDVGAGKAIHGQQTGILETFSRPLWGLTPWTSGASDNPACVSIWSEVRRGLVNGCDPSHPGYWGPAHGRDQRCVEMSAIAYAMLMVPQHAWHPLEETDKQRVGAWLEGINNPTVELSENNWLWFRVLVNMALRRIGMNADSSVMSRDLERLDAFYLSDGWYADGWPREKAGGRRGDYYIGMAMHFYALLYARFEGERDPSRSRLYRERAGEFAGQFIHWFAPDGSAIPFGRSLSYRFAQGAFWSACAFAGEEVLPWGVIRGLVTRHLRWWLRQSITTEDGLLTIGYAYPNVLMSEGYISPASPYWAMKIFAVLDLPDTHPFWQAAEEPLPPLPNAAQPQAGKIFQRGPGINDVVALNLGDQRGSDVWLRNAPAKYQKFAYGTKAGFSVSVGEGFPEWGAFDSALAFSIDGRNFRTRTINLDERFSEDHLWARWSPLPEVRVETWLLPWDSCHLRLHWVETKIDCVSLEGGFSLGCSDFSVPLHRSNDGPSEAVARSPLGFSAILDLIGDATPLLTRPEPYTHLLHPLTLLPMLERKHSAGRKFWLATLVLHSSEEETGERSWKNIEAPGIRVSDGSLSVHSQSRTDFEAHPVEQLPKT